MDEQNQRQPDQDPKAPAKLVVGLKGLHKEHIFVPPKVDQSILNAGREHLGETSREPAEKEAAAQPWIPQWAPWAAAAASLMLLLFLTLPGEKQPMISVAKISPMDINEDGQVDILDAFTLASRIEHRTLKEKWDINGDGKIDQADVEEISAFAVKLGPEDNS
jgi:hypothetical protein